MNQPLNLQEKAARCGEPSYVWRAGQEQRLEMVIEAAEERVMGRVLEDGCGVGMYIRRLAPLGGTVFGLEYDFPRAVEAGQHDQHILNAAGEHLPFPPNTFDFILNHEVIEHVQDDRAAIAEIVRTLRPGGRLALFCPNRGYPFETHGIYWKGKYRFGNAPLINYLSQKWRDRLAPHVRVYTQRDLVSLFEGLPVSIIKQTFIFGGYDNIIAKWPRLGRALRAFLQFLERTPLKIFGLSHFWVVEKI